MSIFLVFCAECVCTKLEFTSEVFNFKAIKISAIEMRLTCQYDDGINKLLIWIKFERKRDEFNLKPERKRKDERKERINSWNLRIKLTPIQLKHRSTDFKLVGQMITVLHQKRDLRMNKWLNISFRTTESDRTLLMARKKSYVIATI